MSSTVTLHCQHCGYTKTSARLAVIEYCPRCEPHRTQRLEPLPTAPASTPDADDTLLERILYAALWGDKSIPPADQWNRADSEANGYRRAAEALRTRIRAETAREAALFVQSALERGLWVWEGDDVTDEQRTTMNIATALRAHFGLTDGGATNAGPQLDNKED